MATRVRDEDVCRMLPADAVAQLCAAAAVPAGAHGFDRVRAIDAATFAVRAKYSRFFRHAQEGQHDDETHCEGE